MANPGSGGRWSKLKAKIVDAVVQDCPPEMAACEVCRRLSCNSTEWLGCEKRLAAERFLRVGDQAALESLRTAHRCGCKMPDAGGLGDSGAVC